MPLKKKYSTIPVVTQNPTSLSKHEKGSHLSDLVNKDGLIESLLDAETVEEILSTSIYNKPEVAIREVFNNALRQCRTAKKLGAHPEIHIIFDVKKNRLIFEEIDSMGMTVEIFKDVYRHTGRSGNLDGSESGQFGIGKKSYRAIADTMVFETFARETNEKYAFLAKGNKFEELPEPNLKQFGTRVSFAIKASVKLADLAKYVSTIARFTHVKTFLEFSDDLKENPDHTSILFEKGKTQIGPVNPKEFLAEKLDSSNIEWVEFDKPDYYLLMGFSGYRRDQVIYNNLVGIPVSLGEHEDIDYDRVRQNEIPDPGFSGYILNIKEERKFPPTASRDYLKDDSFKRLSEIIQKDLEEYFSKIDVRTIADYRASPQKYFIENLPHGGFDDVMPRSTLNFHKVLNLNVNTFDSDAKHDDGRYYRTELKELFKKNAQVLCNYNKTMRRINKVLEFSSDVVVLVPEGNKHDRHSSLWIMEQAGMQSISQFMKAKNIKLPKNSSIGEVAVRFGGYGNGVEQMDLDDLTKHCIRIPKNKLDEVNIREFCEVIRNDEFTGFGMFRDQKKFEDTASITLDEFLRDTQKEEFETSEGILTGKQILKKYKSIVLLRVHQSKFESHLNFDFVKEQTKCDLVLVELPNKGNHPTKQQALMLVCNIIKERTFKTISNELDSKIASNLVEPLQIQCDGKWIESPLHAIKYLGEIKSLTVRELYALSYSKVFEHGKGWESEGKEDIKTCQELHELFKSFDDSSKTKMEISQELYEKFKDSEIDYQDDIKDLVKEIIFDGLKEIDDEIQRFTQAAKLVFKDKIDIQTLKVTIPEDKDNYKNDVIVSFETDKKISIGKDIANIINKLSKNYYSLENVIVDGNKIEVVIS